MSVKNRNRACAASRRIVFFSALSAALLGTSSVALASAGCTAFNGSFSGGAISGNTSGIGFDDGDTITLTVIAVGGGDRLGLYNNTTHNPIVMSFNTVGTQTYTVPATTTDEFLISGTQANAGSNFTWSCAAKVSVTGDVQVDGTATVASVSAATITGSIGDVIDDVLDEDDAPPPAPGLDILSRDEFAVVWVKVAYAHIPDLSPELVLQFQQSGREIYDILKSVGRGPLRTASGFEWVDLPSTPSAVSSYLPQTKSDAERYVDEVFASLTANSFKVRATLAPQWSSWLDIRLSGFQLANPNTLTGLQINALAGLSYKAMPGVVIGAFAGYEAFNYEFATLTGSLKGGGATLGTYAGIDLTPSLRLKSSLAWTGLGYDAKDGAATGNFNGSRLLLSTGLTGKIDLGDYLVEPSADILALWEHQTAYTDSLGAAHDARSFSNGRVALGAKAIADQWSDAFTPYLGIYGDWRFASGNAVASAGVSDGWSARVTGGIDMPISTNGTLSLGGEYGGIGADYKVWSGNARLKVQF